MVKNTTIGEFEIDTDKYDGNTIEIRHIPTGKSGVLFEADGSMVLTGYSSGGLPSSPNNTGAVYFDTERAIPAWWDGDNYEWPTFVDNNDVLTSSTTVSNTTDETEIYRFPANSASLVLGRVFKIYVFGSYNTAASEDGFTFKSYVGDAGFDPTNGGGTQIASVSTSNENVTNGPWQAKTTSTVFSVGQNGELKTHVEAGFNNSPADDHKPAPTVDTTTGSVEWVGTVTWNNAKSGNSVTRDEGYLQQQA